VQIGAPESSNKVTDYDGGRQETSPSPSKVQNPSIGVSIRSQANTPGMIVFRADSSQQPASDYYFKLNRLKKDKSIRKGSADDADHSPSEKRGTTSIVNI
jgi:hypothetical protein